MPNAERNPRNQTKDMSFTIQTHASSAFAARGLQERHAHDRSPGHHAQQQPTPHHEALGDACDLTHTGKSQAVAIRQANLRQAKLNESLSFLQTQDFALGQIEELFISAPGHDAFVEGLQSLNEEKFNGSRLFSSDASEECVRINAPELTDSLTIHRPCLRLEESPVTLHEAVLAAREQNHVEQDRLRKISSAANATPGNSKIPGAEIAKLSLARSKSQFLADAPVALNGQANMAHEAVLRLFA